MLILFTSEENNNAEKEQLIHFFENGLLYLHVRKPGITEDELKLWLLQFEAKYLQKMILHQHHNLAEVFPVKGIHLKEVFRMKQNHLAAYIKQFQLKNFTVSTSFHNLEILKREALVFDYVFLSPVFNSISKTGYEGQAFNLQNLKYQVIALGGITAAKMAKTKELGYVGVAVMGSVWLAENKLSAFTEIHLHYKEVYA